MFVRIYFIDFPPELICGVTAVGSGTNSGCLAEDLARIGPWAWAGCSDWAASLDFFLHQQQQFFCSLLGLCIIISALFVIAIVSDQALYSILYSYTIFHSVSQDCVTCLSIVF